MLMIETNDRLSYEGSGVTPFVLIDTYENLLEIKGRSYPEVASSFYFPIQDYIQNRVKRQTRGLFTVNIALEYCNTSSVKCLLGILKELDERHVEQGHPVVINWYYEALDVDNREIGEDLASCLQVPFNFYACSETPEKVIVT